MSTKQYLKEKEAAELIGVAVPTLRNWRFLGKPPAYYKVGNGRAVRYDRADLLEFMEAGRIEPRQVEG